MVVIIDQVSSLKQYSSYQSFHWLELMIYCQTLSLFTLHRYKVINYKSERVFVVNLEIDVCYSASGPCAQQHVVLTDIKLPKASCDYNEEYAITGKNPLRFKFLCTYNGHRC